MLAISVLFRTRYACHLFLYGLGMFAIFFNLISISCQIWSFPVEFDWTIKYVFLLRIISINQIRPEVNVFDRKWILNFENMASIASPYKKISETKRIWQACLAFMTKMATIPSPPLYKRTPFFNFKFDLT